MSGRIEDYALIGDTVAAALVGRDGSIDWLCLPRFDSSACFAALLGTSDHGRWQLAPTDTITRSTRRYRRDSLVLETDLYVADGAIQIVDCMPVRDAHPHVVRVVEGLAGRVAMRMELTPRFDYGQVIPMVQIADGRARIVAGSEALALTLPVAARIERGRVIAELVVEAGQQIPFVLSWQSSAEPPPSPPDPFEAIAKTDAWWRAWADRTRIDGPDREAALRSLLTLKALCHAPTGAIVAAPTTSLPEVIGGRRNWDYRYCWLRDASFTLEALLDSGCDREAEAWRDWLHRTADCGSAPGELQVVYSVLGEHDLGDRVVVGLPGYEASTPVRVGNAASLQLQLDIYGEVARSLRLARQDGIAPRPETWTLERAIFEWLEHQWSEPDCGLWEIRGEPRHYTHSKVMAWVAFDCAIAAVEKYHFDGPIERWRQTRARIHADVCARGFDAELGYFTQSYGSRLVDASLLRLPIVGFLPAADPRIAGTIAAVERDLVRGGLVARYPTHDGDDNCDRQPGREGSFLVCSCWLVEAYVLAGRHAEARALFDRVLALRNDVGLLSEEYDVESARMVGNFPQAFSHVGIIRSARLLARHNAYELGALGPDGCGLNS